MRCFTAKLLRRDDFEFHEFEHWSIALLFFTLTCKIPFNRITAGKIYDFFTIYKVFLYNIVILSKNDMREEKYLWKHIIYMIKYSMDLY